MTDQDLKTMSKVQLKERLDKLRAARRASYAPSQRKKSKVDPTFANLPANVAEKILADLIAEMKKKEEEV